jgi:GTP pyrophosphokinase
VLLEGVLLVEGCRALSYMLGWLEQSELEDLSFMFAHPEEYVEVKHRVQVLCKEQEEVVLEAKKVLLQTILKDQFLSYMTLDVKVVIVCKELYSIFKKMQETKCSADEIRDIAQLRIILRLKSRAMVGPLCNAQQVCYHVLGLVHAMWPPVPQTMKDYIATPKPNGYQSLHTTLIPFGSKTFFPLEIQVHLDQGLNNFIFIKFHKGRLQLVDTFSA